MVVRKQLWFGNLTGRGFQVLLSEYFSGLFFHTIFVHVCVTIDRYVVGCLLCGCRQINLVCQHHLVTRDGDAPRCVLTSVSDAGWQTMSERP